MPTILRKAAAKLSLVSLLLLVALAGALPLSAELPPLVPRMAFFGGAANRHFMISPDGARLAHLGPTPKGAMGLWLRTPGRDDSRLLTDNPLALGSFQWAYDNRHLLFLRDTGAENFHLISVDAVSGEPKDLTPFDGVKAQNLLVEPGKANECLIGLNKRDKRYFDIYRVNLDSGALAPECENPGDVRWWLADAALEVRAAVALDQATGATILRLRYDGRSPWRDAVTWPFGETGFVEGYGSEIAVAFTADGRSLYVNAPFGADSPRLALVDARTGALQKIVAEDAKSEIWCISDQTLYMTAQVLLDPKTRAVQAAAFNYLVPEWKAVDPAFAPDFDLLRKAHAGVFTIASRDATGAKWVVEYSNDVGPGAEYLYDRGEKKATRLSEIPAGPAGLPLAAMKPVVIRSRDGLSLPGYLSLPAGVEPKNLPLVLYVHGGPWSRDDWGFNPLSQILGNRGYAVLQVNYRGSTGFGKAFLNAGNGQWGAKMQDDLADAVRWAVDQGIADPKRIGILGGSYGGYAALAGACFQSDIFACSIAICGISNVRSFLETIPAWWEPIRVRIIKRTGPVLEDAAFNERISPLFHTAGVKTKILVFHGGNDPRVNIRESDQIVSKLRENGADVSYIVCPDEGHGFRRGANLLDEMGRIEEFLAKHLGGRCEPWTAVPGSSAQIK